MPQNSPGRFDFARGSGWPGSRLTTQLSGPDAHLGAALAFFGAGVSGWLIGTAGADQAVAVVQVDADAAPGPRRARLSFAAGPGSPAALEGVFHVAARSGYGGGKGVGSHLI